MPETMLRQLVTLVELPALRAATDPSAACVDDGDLALDNAAFLERVLRAAAALARHGVQDGDVVAVVLPDRTELLIVLFAVWRLGAVATPLDPAMSRAELEFYIEDSGARLTIGAGVDLGTQTVHVDAMHGEVVARDLPAPPAGTAAAALFIYAGGAGRPKAVVLDAANLLAMSRSAAAALEVDDRDHGLVALPLFHVTAIVLGMLMPLLAGGQTTVGARLGGAAVCALVPRVRPTYVLAAPATYAELAELPSARSGARTSLRFALCTARPMEPELIDRVERRLDTVLVEGYGLAEGTCASTLNPINARKPGTVGVALPGQEVRIMDRDGNFTVDGERGEVVIRGPVVMRGYLNRDAATRTAIEPDGWLHTGDAGVLDEDGYLRVLGPIARRD
jgi:acyl-CoA synthetase (AMP-forming)/AMP-acid ligase II